MDVAKKVTVKSLGATDTFANASVSETPRGSLIVSHGNTRTRKRSTYASGRWTKVEEEGIQDG